VMQIGWGRKKDADVSTPSIRLTRDLLSDLREVVRVACDGGRCGNVMQLFVSAATKILRVSRPKYQRLDQETGAVEPFGHYSEWRVSADAAQARVGCRDSSTGQVLCDLTLTMHTGEVLQYDTLLSTLTLEKPAGHIEFSQFPSGGALVTISGEALALRAAISIGTGK
jgi:hypothetical protein